MIRPITHAAVVQRRRPLLHLRDRLGKAGGVHQERRGASPHQPRSGFGRGATVAPAPHVPVGDLPERGLERRGAPRGRRPAPVARRVAGRAGLGTARAPRLGASAQVDVFVIRVTHRVASRRARPRGGAHFRERTDGKASVEPCRRCRLGSRTPSAWSARRARGVCVRVPRISVARLGAILGRGKTPKRSERPFRQRMEGFFPLEEKVNASARPRARTARRGAGGGRTARAESPSRRARVCRARVACRRPSPRRRLVAPRPRGKASSGGPRTSSSGSRTRPRAAGTICTRSASRASRGARSPRARARWRRTSSSIPPRTSCARATRSSTRGTSWRRRRCLRRTARCARRKRSNARRPPGRTPSDYASTRACVARPSARSPRVALAGRRASWRISCVRTRASRTRGRSSNARASTEGWARETGD